MFNQNTDEEKKLDWMYKGPNSTVNREEYLLGRSVDKTLEQLNDEEKQKQQGLLPQPKNRVEHECIPPSIRDFNKLVQAEQVDLSTKLQEDPLVAIKKREEETRRQFLQNPVQLKKLQKALKAQQAKKKKKKKKKKLKESSDSENDLEKKLAEKLLGQKNKKVSKEERNLDIILIHKYEALKDKLTESDLQDILNGKITDSEDSDNEIPKKKLRKKDESSEESEGEKRVKQHRNVHKRDRRREGNRDSSDDSRGRNRNRERSRTKMKTHEYKQNKRRSPDRHKPESGPKTETRNNHSKKYDSDDSDSPRSKKINYGLVTSDGKKIPFSKKHDREETKPKASKAPVPPPPVEKRKIKKLTEEEKEKLRREMMENAIMRDRERAHNLKEHREKEEKERKEQNFDPEFIHKQLLKSADTSSVESRIKSNLNNIQRSSRAMDKNFSRR